MGRPGEKRRIQGVDRTPLQVNNCCYPFWGFAGYTLVYHNVTRFELRVTRFALRVSGCGIRVTMFVLLGKDCRLRATHHGFIRRNATSSLFSSAADRWSVDYWISKIRTLNPRNLTRNAQLATRNPQPATRNKQINFVIATYSVILIIF